MEDARAHAMSEQNPKYDSDELDCKKTKDDEEVKSEKAKPNAKEGNQTTSTERGPEMWTPYWTKAQVLRVRAKLCIPSMRREKRKLDKCIARTGKERPGPCTLEDWFRLQSIWNRKPDGTSDYDCFLSENWPKTDDVDDDLEEEEKEEEEEEEEEEEYSEEEEEEEEELWLKKKPKVEAQDQVEGQTTQGDVEDQSG